MQFLENKNKIFSLLSNNKKQEICYVTAVNYAIEANQVNTGVLPILAGVRRGEEGVNCTVLERACHYELIQPDLMWLLSCELLAIPAAVIY
jgi:hypothetical protein